MQKKISQLYYFIDEYNNAELSKLSKNINIIYRNYKKNIDISTLISIRNYCKKNKIKFFISNNIKLAIKYKLDGIYIPAFNKQINFIKFLLPMNFKIIGSAHNNIEILIKQKQGCSLIFVSPIFKVKKKKSFLDVIRFNLLTLNKKIKFVALGGISEKNKNRLNLLTIYGFAGISYFQKKTAPQGGRLNY
ncbi:thiamine phosphate synthase [Candidatus Pelagibacter sp.]|jgi:thiamine-phosphate pyrophosphorylase|nr:thiamine phosphate synthase [Candidatus Pelagibacter sp.]